MTTIEKKFLLFILLIVPFSGIGIDLYAPSLPAIAQSLNSTEEIIRLTIAVYLLGLGITQPIFGALSDHYGRKPLLIAGFIGFGLTSIFLTLVHTALMLVLFRLLQGAFAAATSVGSKSMVSDIFAGSDKMHSVSSKMGIAYGLGPIIAPVIGGYLLHWFGWRANFVFLFGLSAVLLIMVALLLPESLQKKTAEEKRSVMGVLIGYGQVIREPLFIAAVVVMAIIFSFDGIFHLLGPFIVQRQLNYSPIIYGYLALVLGAAYFFGCIANDLLVKRLSANGVIHIGLGCLMLATCAMTGLFSLGYINLYTLVIPIFITFLSGGFIIPNFMANCLNQFPEKAGIASAVIGCLMIILTGIILSIISMIRFSAVTILAATFLGLSFIVLIIFLIYLRKNASFKPF